MLTAINKNTKEKINLCESILEKPKQIEWICPICDKKLIHVKESYDGKIEHFRHEKYAGHESEPESRNHIFMKKTVYQLMKRYYKNVFLEKKIGERVADILIESGTGKIAIECQASALSKKRFFERSKSYTDMDVAVLWIWHEDLFCENKCIQLMTGLCTRMFYNRIYIFRAADGEICRSRYATKHTESLGVIAYNLKFGFAKIPSTMFAWIPNALWEPYEETTIKIAMFWDKKWWGL